MFLPAYIYFVILLIFIKRSNEVGSLDNFATCHSQVLPVKKKNKKKKSEKKPIINLVAC